MKIDELPVETLMIIFNYLPTCGEISLVNKLFYNIACKVTDPNICLRIEYWMNSQLLQSMRSSHRKISKIKIGSNPLEGFLNSKSRRTTYLADKFAAMLTFFIPSRDKQNESLFLPKEMQRTLSIVKNFDTTNRTMVLSRDMMNRSTFLGILPQFHNIEHLKLKHLLLPIEKLSFQSQDCNKDLNMKKLKTLSVIQCDPDYLTPFIRLPTGVLTELRAVGFRWDTLIAVLRRQLNIKKLALKFTFIDRPTTDIFDKLELDSLEWVDFHDSSIVRILSKQTNLKSLLLSKSILSDSVMNAISHLVQLEVLKIVVDRTPVESFKEIRKLKKLKDLTLKCYKEGTDILKTLAESKNSSIIKMHLRWEDEMPLDDIKALATSVPNLKHIRFSRSKFENSTTTELDAIMRHFNFVEVLKISICHNSPFYHSDYFNPKLNELSIHVVHPDEHYNQLLPILIAAYPNLKKLKLTLGPISSLEIEPILNAFVKLESLIVDVPNVNTSDIRQLSVTDLSYLCDHKNNLKFVYLARLCNVSLNDSHLKKLRENFDVLRLDCARNLKMAVDRYTMSSENGKIQRMPDSANIHSLIRIRRAIQKRMKEYEKLYSFLCSPLLFVLPLIIIFLIYQRLRKWFK